MDNDILRIQELVKNLNEASKAYYTQDDEIMSNFEYDQFYDELESLEKKTHFILSESPTRKVGYEVVSELPKESHSSVMLSLDKTKNLSSLVAWVMNQKAMLSWKLDGLTIVLTYKEGYLVKAVTRGNGSIGEVVTNNARVFKNVPLYISYKEELVIRGEAVIKYSDFNKINESLPIEDHYKNPRNLCSGSVRQLNNAITAKRNVHFFAFQMIQTEEMDFGDSKSQQLEWLKKLGFDTVPYELVDESSIEAEVIAFSEKIQSNDFGSDGLVLTYDSIAFSESLGATSKFPRHSIAYKWQDEVKETQLLEIEWSASRTGLINPIAVFEPVELEGTTVSRASVHNLSIMEALALGVGDVIEVYKANMIIPQISDNKTRSGSIIIPQTCPSCEGETQVRQVNQVKSLYCINEECPAKKIKKFAHFVSRDAMNIDGLSEATLEKFVSLGFVKTLGDLYRLENHQNEIVEMEGFGRKSYDNLLNALEKSKEVHLSNFIFALAIPNVGLSNAKLLCKSVGYDFERIFHLEVEELLQIEGFGGVIATSIGGFFGDENNKKNMADLLQYIKFIKEDMSSQNLILQDQVFVITGSLEKFENRNALKAKIEQLGGKVTGSVTSKTDFLINNEIHSASSKNKAAQALGIKIIDEEGFLKLTSEINP